MNSNAFPPWTGPTWLYLTNAVLLSVHEIDSAYWHEWSLLGLPGGIQFFLLLHLLLLAIVLWGFRQVVLWKRGAKAFSYFLAAAGIVAFAIHGTLIATGSPEFRLPVSQAVLWSTLLVSLAQIAVVWRCPRPNLHKTAPEIRLP
jgi:hypothetical protein